MSLGGQKRSLENTSNLLSPTLTVGGDANPRPFCGFSQPEVRRARWCDDISAAVAIWVLRQAIFAFYSLSSHRRTSIVLWGKKRGWGVHCSAVLRLRRRLTTVV